MFTLVLAFPLLLAVLSPDGAAAQTPDPEPVRPPQLGGDFSNLGPLLSQIAQH